MIDLRKEDLPDTITVDGKSFKIKTGFKEWLEFGERIKEKDCLLTDLIFLFEDEIPESDFSLQLFEFFMNENSTPNYNDSSQDLVLDYIEDGEYIYASFMSEYGIDLIEDNIHWHRFKALLIGLSDDSKIKQIMGMRAYKKSDKKPDQIALENKKAWALVSKKDRITQEEKIKQVNELFFGC